jgi:hypothetical protein
MRAILAAVAVLVLAASASAKAASGPPKTLKVPQQHPTIQEAVDAAAPGDTIVVAKGTYSGTVVVNTPGLRLVGRKAILDGNVAGQEMDILIVNEEDVTVQGFVFRNGAYQVYGVGARLTLRKCVFRGSKSTAVNLYHDDMTVTQCRIEGAAGAGLFARGDRISVTRNTVRSCMGGGMHVEGLEGIVDRNTVRFSFAWGIWATGLRVRVAGNRISACLGEGIHQSGDEGTIEANLLSTVYGWGIYASGNRMTVEGNLVSGCGHGLLVEGSDLRVRSNGATGLDGAGIVVVGDSFEITDNAVRGAGYVGFEVHTVSGGGLVKGNLAQDTGGAGFAAWGIDGVVLEDNRALACGTFGAAGFQLEADDCTLSRNEAVGTFGDGFRIGGDENTIVDCVARDSVADGFDVMWGSFNTLRGCTATGNGGEGLDNGASDTSVDGGTFLDNRIDIAQSGGSFRGGLAGVNYKPGGTSAVAEVD